MLKTGFFNIKTEKQVDLYYVVKKWRFYKNTETEGFIKTEKLEVL